MAIAARSAPAAPTRISVLTLPRGRGDPSSVPESLEGIGRANRSRAVPSVSFSSGGGDAFTERCRPSRLVPHHPLAETPTPVAIASLRGLGLTLSVLARVPGRAGYGKFPRAT